jgi:hypothetical protein
VRALAFFAYDVFVPPAAESSRPESCSSESSSSDDSSSHEGSSSSRGSRGENCSPEGSSSHEGSSSRGSRGESCSPEGSSSRGSRGQRTVPPKSHTEMRTWLRSWGFALPEPVAEATFAARDQDGNDGGLDSGTAAALAKALRAAEGAREGLGYDVDGVVFKVDDLALREVPRVEAAAAFLLQVASTHRTSVVFFFQKKSCKPASKERRRSSDHCVLGGRAPETDPWLCSPTRADDALFRRSGARSARRGGRSLPSLTRCSGPPCSRASTCR